MKKIALIGIILFSLIVILSLAFMFTSSAPISSDWKIKESGEIVGQFEEKLIMTYQDGSTSELSPQWLYHDSKIIERMEYQLYGIPEDVVMVDMSQFQLSYDLINSRGNTVKQDSVSFDQTNLISVSGKTLLVSKQFSPFDFVNYTFSDDEYIVSFNPSGSIIVDDMETILPRSFDVQITVKDERAIDIGFN